ncbi:MAG: YggT family protein [Clostridia bacterium]|nr:YggT family protein [Clostridia bacterium]
MPEPLYVLVQFVLIFLDVISFSMLIRAILSFLGVNEGGLLMRFLYVVTEPAIMPLRKLFYKLNWFQNTPFDMAHLFTYTVLWILQLLISSLI